MKDFNNFLDDLAKGMSGFMIVLFIFLACVFPDLFIEAIKTTIVAKLGMITLVIAYVAIAIHLTIRLFR